MSKEKVKVYIYTRVSTSMQVDGYSWKRENENASFLPPTMTSEIAGEYEDAGKSGKSLEGRVQFNRMMRI